jgi:hypothetical protein
VNGWRDFRGTGSAGDGVESVISAEATDVQAAGRNRLNATTTAGQKFPLVTPAILDGGEHGAGGEQVESSFFFGDYSLCAVGDGFGERGFDVEAAAEDACGKVDFATEANEHEEVENAADVFVHGYGRCSRESEAETKPTLIPFKIRRNLLFAWRGTGSDRPIWPKIPPQPAMADIRGIICQRKGNSEKK